MNSFIGMAFTILTKFGLPLVKFIFEKKAQKKLSDKEFGELITAHMEQRSGAGKTVTDGEDSIADLESRIAKKKD